MDAENELVARSTKISPLVDVLPSRDPSVFLKTIQSWVMVAPPGTVAPSLLLAEYQSLILGLIVMV